MKENHLSEDLLLAAIERLECREALQARANGALYRFRLECLRMRLAALRAGCPECWQEFEGAEAGTPLPAVAAACAR